MIIFWICPMSVIIISVHTTRQEVFVKVLNEQPYLCQIHMNTSLQMPYSSIVTACCAFRLGEDSEYSRAPGYTKLSKVRHGHPEVPYSKYWHYLLEPGFYIKSYSGWNTAKFCSSSITKSLCGFAADNITLDLVVLELIWHVICFSKTGRWEISNMVQWEWNTTLSMTWSKAEKGRIFPNALTKTPWFF